MTKRAMPKEDKYAKARRRRIYRHRIVTLMAAVVVFCTVYALILPAITLEKNNTQETERILTCTIENQEHQHTEECFDRSEEIVENTGKDIDIAVFAEEAQDTITVLDESDTSGSALKVEDYISKAALFYKTDKITEWTEITGNETSIPGDASFKLEISFEKVRISNLISAGYKMTYTLPEIFRDAMISANITSGNEAVGTMDVQNGVVILKFDPDWINKQQNEEKDVLNGSFFVEAKANLSNIPNGGTTNIIVGNTNIKINFESDLIAKYGNVEIEKTLVGLEESEDGDFLNYTLTVTAGTDGCPDVKVVDSFTAGQSWVEKYVINEDSLPNGESVTVDDTNHTFTWNIGEMARGETRSLTYKVKLKEGYLGVTPKDVITNSATVYSKEYSRDTDTATFTPQAKATLSKASASYVPDETGGGTIQYTVWVKAQDTNNYVLDNVTIWDALDGSVSGGLSTDKAFLQYLTYEENSFHLYQGGVKGQNGSVGLTELTNAGSVDVSETNKSFRYNVGNLTPGECRTLIYTVKVDVGAFAQSNVDFDVGNRVTVLTDPSRTDGGNTRLENFHTKKTITAKKWTRKLLGEKVTESKSVSMTGTICDTSGNSTKDTSFTIPVGSYQYQVLVNEAGDWNVSSAVMQDNLGENGYMHYVGYVRVDAFSLTDGTNYKNDQNAVEFFAGRTPKETVWVKIDGQKSFSFTPTEIGLANDNYAYRLTYYAVPEYLGDLSSVIVANKFDLTGTVGIGGKYYVLGEIHVSASVTLQGGNYFSASKQFWYYDRSAKETDASSKGALYWVIQAQGSLIPSGTAFKDVPQESSHKNGQLVGAFTAESINDFSKYSDWNALQKCNGYAEFSGYRMENTTEAPDTLQWILTEDVRPNTGESLYFIVATYPTTIPESNGTSQMYSNKLYTKDPGDNTEWIDQSSDLHYIVGGDNLYKEMAEVFKVEVGADPNSTTITNVQGNSGTVLQNDYLMKSGNGIYVAWFVYLNHASTLNGRYRVSEMIPDGMEVVYIQRYSTGNRPGPTFAEISELQSSKEWTEVQQNFTFIDKNPTTAIYYINGQNVIWEVEGLQTSEKPNGSYADYLVVCKLTDSDVLLGGETKTFNNKVTLLDTSGNQIGYDENGVELSAPRLSKTGTYNANVNGGRYPFQITLNELGTDLVPGTDTIKLIDEMCDILILDPSSINVINTKTKESVAFTSAIEGHTLTLTLPDDQPLTITYEATINAAPGQMIAITNNAHWEGYTTTEGSGVKIENFSYSAGATVGTTTSAKLTLIKSDQYNNQLKLKDAVFELQEMELLNGTDEENTSGVVSAGTVSLVEASDGLKQNGMTDADGTLVFDNNLKFNTIYRLTETKAPEGYVLDDTPYYFIIAKEEDSTKHTYPSWFETAAELNVYIHYSGAEYTYYAYNHKGEIEVTKKFENADGSSLDKLNGTYKFGLFEKTTDMEDEDSSQESNSVSGTEDRTLSELTLIQTVQITYQNHTVTPTSGVAVFTNVELGKTYYVYELDDKGNPILSGNEGNVGGIPFVVSYDKTEISVSADSSIGNITVTNRMNYAELPSTGGNGTLPYTAGGVLLLSASMCLLYDKLRRRKEEKTTS